MHKDECDDLRLRVEKVERAVFGNGSLGIAQQNNIMWRIHVWVLCAASAVFGTFGTIIIQRLMK